jgi:hypothetical protein
MSSCGIYFVSGNAPGVGSRLNLRITLLAETDGGDAIIEVLAKVIRVDKPTERSASGIGTAVTLERYKIVRQPEESYLDLVT